MSIIKFPKSIAAISPFNRHWLTLPSSLANRVDVFRLMYTLRWVILRLFSQQYWFQIGPTQHPAGRDKEIAPTYSPFTRLIPSCVDEIQFPSPA